VGSSFPGHSGIKGPLAFDAAQVAGGVHPIIAADQQQLGSIDPECRLAAYFTHKDLLEIREELRNREPPFHHPELGTKRDDYERMTDPEFREVEASGRRYSREHCIRTLAERYSAPYRDDLEVSDFHCTEISEGSYLATYTLLEDGERLTRRATIWRRTSTGWKVSYHQGTIVEDS